MSVTLGNLGTTSLVGTPSSTTVATKGVAGGTNITVTSSSTDVTIAYNTPYCQVISGSPGSWTAGTNANILYNTDLSDTTGMHSTSSNTDRINIATAGLYALNLTLQYTVSGTPTGNVYFYFIRVRSAVETIVGSLGVYGRINDTYLINMSCIVALQGSDYVVTRLNNTLGGVTVTPVYSGVYTPMCSICYVGTP